MSISEINITEEGTHMAVLCAVTVKSIEGAGAKPENGALLPNCRWGPHPSRDGCERPVSGKSDAGSCVRYGPRGYLRGNGGHNLGERIGTRTFRRAECEVRRFGAPQPGYSPVRSVAVVPGTGPAWRQRLPFWCSEGASSIPTWDTVARGIPRGRYR